MTTSEPAVGTVAAGLPFTSQVEALVHSPSVFETYVSNTDGEWTNASTWLVNGNPAATVPTAGSDVVIHHKVDNFSDTAYINSITFSSALGGKGVGLTNGSRLDIAANGQIIVDASAPANVAIYNHVNLAGALTISTASATATLTFIVDIV